MAGIIKEARFRHSYTLPSPCLVHSFARRLVTKEYRYNNQKALLLSRATSPLARLLSEITHGAD